MDQEPKNDGRVCWSQHELSASERSISFSVHREEVWTFFSCLTDTLHCSKFSCGNRLLLASLRDVNFWVSRSINSCHRRTFGHIVAYFFLKYTSLRLTSQSFRFPVPSLQPHRSVAFRKADKLDIRCSGKAPRAWSQDKKAQKDSHCSPRNTFFHWPSFNLLYCDQLGHLH